MLDETEIMRCAMNEMISAFGKKYLQENFENICKADGFLDNGKVFQLFLGIKTKDDLPNKEYDFKGWVVYGIVRIDTETGETIDKEMVTE